MRGFREDIKPTPDRQLSGPALSCLNEQMFDLTIRDILGLALIGHGVHGGGDRFLVGPVVALVSPNFAAFLALLRPWSGAEFSAKRSYVRKEGG